MNSAIQFTDEQRLAIETLSSLPHDVQTLGGYAGTGKTTVIRALLDRLKGFAVCAYTGKAAQVLRRKRVPATTIHSLIYRIVGGDGNGPVSFELKDDDFAYDGIIIDEGSMVPESIYDDLRSLNVPLIFIGDHGQLEPVLKTSERSTIHFSLMKSPQLTLTKIHRNAGEIALFAEYLREGGEAARWPSERPNIERQVWITSANDLDKVEGITEDCQIIAAYNKTRVGLNKMVREHLGRPESPCIGDRVICCQNDRNLRIFNGMQGRIKHITHKLLTFIDDDDREVETRYNPDAFGAERTPPYSRGIIPFDWAYCITCHKAQGDEWEHVVVAEQRCDKWEHRRWAYTAASRAKDRLTWILG